MNIIGGVDQHPLAECINPDLVDAVVPAVVFKPWPAAQHPGQVAKAVEHSMLDGAEMCAMELPALQCRIEDRKCLLPRPRGIVFVERDMRPDPVAQEQNPFPLIPLPGHNSIKPIPRAQFADARVIIILEPSK